MTANPTRARASRLPFRWVLYALTALALAPMAQAQWGPQGTRHRCHWRWPGETWQAPDKRQHLAGGAVMGLAFGLMARSPSDGFVAAAGVGFAWEAASWITGRGYCSGMDFAATAIGVALGAGGSRLVIWANERGTPIVGYSWTMR